MSDDDNLDPNALGDDGQPNWRRKLEADAKAGREASKALAEEQAKSLVMQQEVAMRRAGIDYDSPLAQMFAKANPGLVAVDELAAEWGKIAPGAQQQGVNAGDMAALQQIGNAVSGGQSSGAPNLDFEAQLDAIPMLIDGKLNPNYTQEILAKTAEQAAREGRQFSSDGRGVSSWSSGKGTNQNTPATAPLRG